MALLLIEGFEGLGTTTGAAPQPTDALGRLYSVIGESAMDIETGRLSGYSLEFGGHCSIKTGVITVDATLIIGIAFKISALSHSGSFIELYDSGTKGINLFLNTSGQLKIYRGAVLLDTSAPVITATGTWYYIELKVLCDNAAGTYEVKVGGVSVLSGAGVDTQEGANAYHDRVLFQKVNFYTYTTIDDIYIADSTGAQNNDFLGNVRVVAIAPDGDDTATFDTASGGGAHHLDVDENPADDDTTYVESNLAGEKDLYDYAAMAAGLGAIKGLEVKTICRETDAVNYSLITPIKSNVTESDDVAQAIGTTNYTAITRISELDPDTAAAWIEAGINAAKFGVKIG